MGQTDKASARAMIGFSNFKVYIKEYHFLIQNRNTINNFQVFFEFQALSIDCLKKALYCLLFYFFCVKLLSP